jgi:hypothetical protein
MPDEVLVSIPKPEVERTYSLLSTLYHYTLSSDLSDQYKNLMNSITLSPLTREVGRQRDALLGYLEDTEDE